MDNLRYKFRAWHMGAKEMLEHKQQGYEGNVFKWLHEGQPVIIMQWTGLLDNNDKEIYEWDIILQECSGMKYIIKWEGDGFQLHELKTNKFQFGRVDFDAIIIGNIFENPELLNP